VPLLEGMAAKTIEAYSCAIRRSAKFFGRCPDDLTAEELQAYCASTAGVAFLVDGEARPLRPTVLLSLRPQAALGVD